MGFYRLLTLKLREKKRKKEGRERERERLIASRCELVRQV